ncbi:hypothetical protein B0H14DRAFT_3543457 [Mycena olivaceomarginata]|nr:hypothetical protein B0H14DRAFT_3543457 [Mycena olivaceomarginata]
MPRTIPLKRWLRMTGGVIDMQRPSYRLIQIFAAAHPNFLDDISILQRHGIILFVIKTLVTNLEGVLSLLYRHLFERAAHEAAIFASLPEVRAGPPARQLLGPVNFSSFSVREGRSGTYALIVEDGGSDQSAFSMREGRSGTYILIVEDGGSDRSASSMREGCCGTYKLIVEDGGSDRSASSVWEGRSGTYFLIVEGGVSDRSAFSVREGRSGTYALIVEDGGSDRSAACRRVKGRSILDMPGNINRCSKPLA